MFIVKTKYFAMERGISPRELEPVWRTSGPFESRERAEEFATRVSAGGREVAAVRIEFYKGFELPEGTL